ncbi:hypothetical protein NQZ68_026997 [Dissostichus eleginoides]|nr:hypothetical protein NQZ68_026997 [Dissostichus eleginoides]
MGVRLGCLSDSPWWPPPLLLLLFFTVPFCSGRPFGVPTPAVNVAVVFSGSAYQTEIKGRLSRENFMDLPLEVNPITVLVNNTNPRALLTRICDTLSTNRVHGVVFEDNVGSEAVAQILDFISTQTAVPIVGISGGSAVVLPYKYRVKIVMANGHGVVGLFLVAAQDLRDITSIGKRLQGISCCAAEADICRSKEPLPEGTE